MAKEQNDTKYQMDNLIHEYINNINGFEQNQKTNELELEVRFGTRGVKSISKLDHDTIIQKLISNGFKMTSLEDNTFLRMSPEYIDTRTGQIKISNLRVEISSTELIQQYCINNNIDILADQGNVSFTVKRPVSKDGNVIQSVNNDNWNFRMALSEEKSYGLNSSIASNTLGTWKDSKKIFRLITRNSFVSTSENYKGFRIDLSVVRESARRGRFLQPAYTFQSSGITDSIPKYEVEIEVLPEVISTLKTPNSVEELHKRLRRVILLVLGALQQTNYPVSYPEQKDTLTEYMSIIHGDWKDDKKRIGTRDFIGPSSYTLSVNNIAPINPDNQVPNIRNNYTVTDKADGARKIMIVNKVGKIYLLDTNMNIQFTGAKTEEKTLFNSIIDGEHILHDKTGKFINLYAVFDIYFINKKDIRKLPFMASDNVKETEPQSELIKNYRFHALTEFVSRLELKNINGSTSPITINVKKFYNTSDNRSIFQCCGFILNDVKDGLFQYETDGLIFTPSELGVSMNNSKDTVKNTKSTWDYSFKWKPAHFNTIDFLVSTKKNENGSEYVGNMFQKGVELKNPDNLIQYKTLILRVGFDEKRHGYINPCQDIIDDKIPEHGDKDDDSGYRPMQFFPTTPYDPNGGICNITLQGSSDNRVMVTEEGEVFTDDTIVEFRYELNREHGWRWIPLRVRHDKTAEYLAKGRNYGNAYHVANSNWKSIHNPITEHMISTGKNIPDEIADDDVYYNRVSNDNSTRGLRDFHNLYVKKMLITKTAKRGGTIIDMAAGKGGDLPKWIASRASFVLGIDVAKDNIENRLDGACARYLNYRKKSSNVPDALFIHGDSTANIRSGEAMYTDKGRQIVKAIFGQGSKDANVIGKGVVKNFGRGAKGFDLTTIQFSIHYMFKDQQTVQNIMRNISECTKVGGYFVSTQYDGRTVYNKLRGLKNGESMTIMEKDKKIWEITKKYDRDEFQDDSTSVGYAIDVYQETINKVFTEYLVNYNYVVRLMEDYGFVPLTQDESKRLGFKSSSGMFEELYDILRNEIKKTRNDPEASKQYGMAINMTDGEKKISFLNRWMIFKKVRDVDTASVARNLMSMSLTEEKSVKKQEVEAKEVESNAIISSKPSIQPKKLKRRIKLKIINN